VFDTTYDFLAVRLLLKDLEFDWEQWNIQKKKVKHGVSALEAESGFFDHKLKIFKDLKHSTTREKRFVCYAKSNENRVLMIGFTIRRSKVRIITARPASKNERAIYG